MNFTSLVDLDMTALLAWMIWNGSLSEVKCEMCAT
jgi:hypothetical protein